MASSMIAPRVATTIDQMNPPPRRPRRPCTRKPPTRAPAIPMRIVTMTPPGSRPGMISLPKAPAISPTIIQIMIPMPLPSSPRLLDPALRPPATGLGAQSTAYGPAGKRREQREDARAGEDRPQVLWGVVGGAGQRHTAEVIYETQAQQRSYARKHYRDHQGQHGDQEAVLEAAAARKTPRDVAADDEGQEQRKQEPYEARSPALRG